MKTTALLTNPTINMTQQEQHNRNKLYTFFPLLICSLVKSQCVIKTSHMTSFWCQYKDRFISLLLGHVGIPKSHFATNTEIGLILFLLGHTDITS